MPRPRSARWAAVVAIAVLAAGCGAPPTGTVRGTVSVEGQPVVNGLITFSSEVGNRDVYSAVIVNGKYTTDPIPAGATKVTVVNRMANPAEAPAPAAGGKQGIGSGLGSGDLAPPPKTAAKKSATVPAKYGTSDKSGLTYDVTAGDQTKDFDLTP